MAVTYGFYNAIDHDRQYNARHLSRIFDGVIEDGVYDSIGNKFAVTPNTTVSGALKVNVDTGRAWFNGTWTYNDAMITLDLAAADLVQNRIDAIVLEVDTRQAKTQRRNQIKVIQGSYSTGTPTRPTMTRSTADESVNQYPLAYVTVSAKASTVTTAMISNAVGTAACPYASIIGNRETRLVQLTASGWSASSGIYTQKVTKDVNGVALPYTSDSMPYLSKYLDYSASAATATAYNEAFGIVAQGTGQTSAGAVTFKCYSKPATTIIVALRGQ